MAQESRFREAARKYKAGEQAPEPGANPEPGPQSPEARFAEGRKRYIAQFPPFVHGGEIPPGPVAREGSGHGPFTLGGEIPRARVIPEGLTNLPMAGAEGYEYAPPQPWEGPEPPGATRAKEFMGTSLLAPNLAENVEQRIRVAQARPEEALVNPETGEKKYPGLFTMFEGGPVPDPYAFHTPGPVESGITRGAATSVQDLTSPAGLGMVGGLAATGGTSLMAVPAVRIAVSLGIGIPAMIEAVKQYPQLREEYENEDWENFAKHLTETAVPATIGVLGIKHGVSGLRRGLVDPIRQARRQRTMPRVKPEGPELDIRQRAPQEPEIIDITPERPVEPVVQPGVRETKLRRTGEPDRYVPEDNLRIQDADVGVRIPRPRRRTADELEEPVVQSEAVRLAEELEAAKDNLKKTAEEGRVKIEGEASKITRESDAQAFVNDLDENPDTPGGIAIYAQNYLDWAKKGFETGAPTWGDRPGLRPAMDVVQDINKILQIAAFKPGSLEKEPKVTPELADQEAGVVTHDDGSVTQAREGKRPKVIKTKRWTIDYGDTWNEGFKVGDVLPDVDGIPELGGIKLIAVDEAPGFDPKKPQEFRVTTVQDNAVVLERRNVKPTDKPEPVDEHPERVGMVEKPEEPTAAPKPGETVAPTGTGKIKGLTAESLSTGDSVLFKGKKKATVIGKSADGRKALIQWDPMAGGGERHVLISNLTLDSKVGPAKETPEKKVGLRSGQKETIDLGQSKNTIEITRDKEGNIRADVLSMQHPTGSGSNWIEIKKGKSGGIAAAKRNAFVDAKETFFAKELKNAMKGATGVTSREQLRSDYWEKAGDFMLWMGPDSIGPRPRIVASAKSPSGDGLAYEYAVRPDVVEGKMGWLPVVRAEDGVWTTAGFGRLTGLTEGSYNSAVERIQERAPEGATFFDDVAIELQREQEAEAAAELTAKETEQATAVKKRKTDRQKAETRAEVSRQEFKAVPVTGKPPFNAAVQHRSVLKGIPEGVGQTTFVKDGIATTSDGITTVMTRTDLADGTYTPFVKGDNKAFRKKSLTQENIDRIPNPVGAEGKDGVVTIGPDIVSDLKRSVRVITDEESRYTLNSAQIKRAGKGQLEIAATDGHRLVVNRIPYEGTLKGKGPWLLGKRQLEMILKDKGSDRIKLILDPGVVTMAGPHIAVSQEIEGTFPKYDLIMPDVELELVLNKKELAAALKKARADMLDDKLPTVAFKRTEEGIEVIVEFDTIAGLDRVAATYANAKDSPGGKLQLFIAKLHKEGKAGYQIGYANDYFKFKQTGADVLSKPAPHVSLKKPEIKAVETAIDDIFKDVPKVELVPQFGSVGTVSFSQRSPSRTKRKSEITVQMPIKWDQVGAPPADFAYNLDYIEDIIAGIKGEGVGIGMTSDPAGEQTAWTGLSEGPKKTKITYTPKKAKLAGKETTKVLKRMVRSDEQKLGHNSPKTNYALDYANFLEGKLNEPVADPVVSLEDGDKRIREIVDAAWAKDHPPEPKGSKGAMAGRKPQTKAEMSPEALAKYEAKLEARRVEGWEPGEPVVKPEGKQLKLKLEDIEDAQFTAAAGDLEVMGTGAMAGRTDRPGPGRKAEPKVKSETGKDKIKKQEVEDEQFTSMTENLRVMGTGAMAGRSNRPGPGRKAKSEKEIAKEKEKIRKEEVEDEQFTAAAGDLEVMGTGAMAGRTNRPGPPGRKPAPKLRPKPPKPPGGDEPPEPPGKALEAAEKMAGGSETEKLSLIQLAKTVPFKLQRLLTSEFQPLKHAEDRIYKELGEELPQLNMARKFELQAGAHGKARLDVLEFDEQVTDVLTRGSKLDFDTYVVLERIVDRLTDNPEVKRVKGWTIERADRAIREQLGKLGQGEFDRMRAIAHNEFQEEVDRALKLQVTSGRMKQEEYDAIKKANPFYSPFKILQVIEQGEGYTVPESTGTPGVGRNIADTQKYTRAITGIDADDVRFESVLQVTRELVYRSRILAEKNLKMLELDKLMLKGGKNNPFKKADPDRYYKIHYKPAEDILHQLAMQETARQGRQTFEHSLMKVGRAIELADQVGIKLTKRALRASLGRATLGGAEGGGMIHLNAFTSDVIAHELGHSFDVPIRDKTGKIVTHTKKVFGIDRDIVDRLSTVINTRKGVKFGSKGKFQIELAALVKQSKLAGSEKYRATATERFAEFINMYIHDPKEARTVAPQWTEYFEKAYLPDPKMQSLVERLGKFFQKADKLPNIMDDLKEMNGLKYIQLAIERAFPERKPQLGVRFGTNPPKGQEILLYFKDGKKQAMMVPTVIAKAVKGLHREEASLFARALHTSSLPLRLGATAYNVRFQFRNLLAADLPRAALVSRYGIQSPKDLPVFMGDWLYSFYSSFKLNFGTPNELGRKFLGSGAANSTISSAVNPETFDPTVERNWGMTVLDTIPKISQAIEETSKLLGIKRGWRIEEIDKLSPEEALERIEYMASEVRNYSGSPDFLRGGSMMVGPSAENLNLLFVFLKARVQGQVSDMARLTGRTGEKERNAAWARLTPVMMAIATAALYNRMAGNRDDYDKRAQWEKDNYFLFPRNSADGKPLYITNQEGEKIRAYWRWPKREITQILGNFIEASVKFADERDPEAVRDFAVSFLENISPVSVSGKDFQERVESIVSNMNPAFKVPIEFGLGKDTFRHRSVIPTYIEGVPSRNLSPTEQYTRSTPDIFIKLGQASGISPMVIEQLVRGASAGLITQFTPRKRPGRPKVLELPLIGPVLDSLVGSEYLAQEADPDLEAAEVTQGDRAVRLNRAAEKTYQLWKQTDQKGSLSEFVTAMGGDKDQGAKVEQIIEDDRLGLTYTERRMKQLQVGNGARAAFLAKKMLDMNESERSVYIADMRRKKIATSTVVRQIGRELRLLSEPAVQSEREDQRAP